VGFSHLRVRVIPSTRWRNASGAARRRRANLLSLACLLGWVSGASSAARPTEPARGNVYMQEFPSVCVPGFGEAVEQFGSPPPRAVVRRKVRRFYGIAPP
jgi:hypothetical protein